jgi:hypothetical protein
MELYLTVVPEGDCLQPANVIRCVEVQGREAVPVRLKNFEAEPGRLNSLR